VLGGYLRGFVVQLVIHMQFLCCDNEDTDEKARGVSDVSPLSDCVRSTLAPAG
jgi:hypothetical protein